METNYLRFIKSQLEKLEKLEPVPTNTAVKIEKDKTIKALVFDIYGTLIISASGDIDKAEFSGLHLKKALKSSGIEWDESINQDKLMQQILQDFFAEVNKQQQESPYTYPEVDILKVWKDLIVQYQEKGLIKSKNLGLKQLAFHFELLSNKVFPMPGMKRIITTLYNRGLPLGIVSNAQFYSPMLMNYLLNNELVEGAHITCFDPDISIYSYKEGRSKPDTFLYEKLAASLEKKYQLSPEEVLYIGNDMLKDIYPAKQIGFKTVLFAGDKRSLRLREDDKRVRETKPDHVIEQLDQILAILE